MYDKIHYKLKKKKEEKKKKKERETERKSREKTKSNFKGHALLYLNIYHWWYKAE